MSSAFVPLAASKIFACIPSITGTERCVFSSEQREQSEQPEQSEQSKQTEQSEQPEQSEQWKQREQSEQREQREQSKQSEQREQSEQRKQREQSEQREQSWQPEQSEQRKQREQSEQREQREQSEQWEQSEQPEQWERVSSDFLAASSEPQFSIDARLPSAPIIQVAMLCSPQKMFTLNAQQSACCKRPRITPRDHGGCGYRHFKRELH
jgi:hypothetical protein